MAIRLPGRNLRRWRLTSGVFALALAGLLLSSLVLIQESRAERERVIAQANEQLVRVTQVVSIQDEQLLAGAQATLSALSEVPQVRTAAAGQCDALLWKVLQAQPSLDMLGVANASGTVTCSALRTKQRVAVGHLSVFQEAMRTGAWSVGRYGIDPTTHRAGVHVAQPILDARGRPVGVVFGALDLTWLDGLRNRVRLPPNAFVAAWDTDGVVLARYPQEETWVGAKLADPMLIQHSREKEEGVALSRGPDGILRLIAFSHVQGPRSSRPIVMAVGIPRDQLFADAQGVLVFRLTVLWGAGVLGLLALALFVHRRLIRPLRALGHAADRLGKGDLSARSGLPHDDTEVGTLANAFDAMALRTEEVTLVRDEFLEVASHEMQTPLASLLLQLQSAERQLEAARRPDGTAHLSAAPLLQKLQFAQRQVWRVTQLVRIVTDARSLQAGKLEPDYLRMDLTALVQSQVDHLAPSFQRAGSDLIFDGPGPLWGSWDLAFVERLVSQLLSNALKFGQARPVVVTLAGGDERVQLRIRDFGLGIPEADQDRIFEPFERAVSARQYGGFGLGLTVARRLAEAMGGEIAVESRAGEGAEFIVDLPRHPDLAPEAENEPRRQEAAAQESPFLH
jgi:signal transduction histidine kinase